MSDFSPPLYSCFFHLWSFWTIMILFHIILRDVVFEWFLIYTTKGLSCWSESSVIGERSPNWTYLECLCKTFTLFWESGRYLLGSLHISTEKWGLLLMIQTVKLVLYSWFWYALHSLTNNNVSIGINNSFYSCTNL